MDQTITTSNKMKFERNKQFDAEFDEVLGLRWYPYVGKHFGENGVRIMVYAHNIPIGVDVYEERQRSYADRATWAKSMEEYTYVQEKYTNAFRYFMKAAVGLKSNYGEHSEPAITQRVDSFVERIAYLNFIQDLVKSDKALARPGPEQIELSKKVNREILRILDITHCICWGTPTYQYVRSITGFKVLGENYLGKNGFSSCIVDVGGGKTMQCLRIYHPSMPGGFDPLSESTQSIISRFLGTEAAENQNRITGSPPTVPTPL
jgi:hypothetical protein